MPNPQFFRQPPPLELTDVEAEVEAFYAEEVCQEWQQILEAQTEGRQEWLNVRLAA